jgi:hypothetical protein
MAAPATGYDRGVEPTASVVQPSYRKATAIRTTRRLLGWGRSTTSRIADAATSFPNR